MRLLSRFQQVERAVLANGGDRKENDVEHSYKLALLAWYLIEADNLPLDKEKAVGYALVHNLVEAYAGDTYFYASEAERAEKVAKEAAALDRLEEEFPEAAGLFGIIHAYERREDEESRFVYALDKVIAPIEIYLDGGRTWKRDGVSLRMLVEGKRDKVKAHPEVERYFDELVRLLEKEDGLFPVGEAPGAC